MAKAIEAVGGRRYNPMLAIPEFLRGPKGTVGNGIVRREVKADIGWVTLDRVSRVTGGIGTEFAVDGRLRGLGGLVRYGGEGVCPVATVPATC